MMQMVHRSFFALVVIFLLVVSSCDDDEVRTYPPLLSEFVTIQTDESGIPGQLRTDKGMVYAVENAVEIVTDGLTPDSVYRAIARYEQRNDVVRIYGLQGVVSSYAIPDSLLADEVKCDPVEMQAIWSGGGYLNMVLLIKAQSGKHSFSFIEDSIIQTTDGYRKLCLSLSHDAHDDTMAYTQEVYLSMPLFPYSGRLEDGDSVIFSIPTPYGWQQWTREFTLPAR